MLDPHPDLFLRVEVEGGTGDSSGVFPSPGPGLGLEGSHLQNLALGEMVNLSGDGCEGSGHHPQGLLHFHQGGTVIWTRDLEFLGRVEFWWWLWFTPSLVPPFLGVDGGAFFLF